MKTCLLLLFGLFSFAAFGQAIVPASLTTCDAGEPVNWFETGHNKINKLQNVVLPSAGVTDTTNISCRISATKAYLYDADHPELFPGAEVINFPGGVQYAFYRWNAIFRIDHIFSKCTNINEVLHYYGYDDGVYYIEFYQNNHHLDTSDFLYSTPIGNKATMVFTVFHM